VPVRETAVSSVNHVSDWLEYLAFAAVVVRIDSATRESSAAPSPWSARNAISGLSCGEVKVGANRGSATFTIPTSSTTNI
jgi:hypothetical protein